MKSDIRYRFGEKLRLVRERRGITMREVAGKAGVSESLVSQIERNKVSPPLDTLLTIAEVLEIDPEYLFKDLRKTKEVSLTRKEERDSLVLDDVQYEVVSVLKDSGGKNHIEILELEIPPGKEKGNIEYGHLGNEAGLITEGSGELYYGNKSFKLNAGDSISFSSDIPHKLQNTGSTPLKAVWVVTPPRFVR